MPSLAVLGQFGAACEARRAPVSLVNIGGNEPKTEKFAYLPQRRGT